MVSPDAGRGSGFGNPEQKQELMEERHAEIGRELKKAHDAKIVSDSRKATEAPRSWWRRLFHRSEP